MMSSTIGNDDELAKLEELDLQLDTWLISVIKAPRSSIPGICYRHHRRCQNILPGVSFLSRLNVKEWMFHFLGDFKVICEMSLKVV